MNKTLANSALERPPRLITLTEACARVGRSRWWVAHEVRAGRFPKPIALGYRSTMFVESEIDAYIASLVTARDRAAVS